jgi:hypothetical protein
MRGDFMHKQFQKPSLGRKLLRFYELIAGIVDFCADWVDEPECTKDPRTMNADKSLSVIESYGVSLSTPNEYLVCNAIRHLESIVNPFNKDALWVILEEQCGFTADEVSLFKNVDYWQQYC